MYSESSNSLTMSKLLLAGFSKSKSGNHITWITGWGRVLQCNLWKTPHKPFLQKNQTLPTHQEPVSSGNEGPLGCETLSQKEWEAICLQVFVTSKWRRCLVRAIWLFLSNFKGLKKLKEKSPYHGHQRCHLDITVISQCVSIGVLHNVLLVL